MDWTCKSNWRNKKRTQNLLWESYWKATTCTAEVDMKCRPNVKKDVRC
jgi:hypothetical protein